MMITRRNWLQGFLGAIGSSAFLPFKKCKADSQKSIIRDKHGDKPACAGRVLLSESSQAGLLCDIRHFSLGDGVFQESGTKPMHTVRPGILVLENVRGPGPVLRAFVDYWENCVGDALNALNGRERENKMIVDQIVNDRLVTRAIIHDLCVIAINAGAFSQEPDCVSVRLDFESITGPDIPWMFKTFGKGIGPIVT